MRISNLAREVDSFWTRILPGRRSTSTSPRTPPNVTANRILHCRSFESSCHLVRLPPLKDKYRLKHIDLFEGCRAELRDFFTKKAAENQFHSLTAIISVEGMEQIAALMPRTKTELLLIDSMTKTKVNCYGDQIMQIVEKYWPSIDEREHNAICNQLRILKDQRVEPTHSRVITIDSSEPTLSYQYSSNANLRRVNSNIKRRRGGIGNMSQARSKASRKK